ncbi:hypothetical protein C7S20_18655 [Christiangramia fulva]|uniref:Uncharacterized protein n=1 Tax=Christiangramia fulva TaxID=2126553 RepID=A0A2R3ZA19_9FLAO|nr:hypothetical protein C7S20_18655 [Christiangramia fulva]
MFKNFIKTLMLVLVIVIIRSLFLQKDFYYMIWENNPVTVVFIISILIALFGVGINLLRRKKLNKDLL